MNGWMILLDGWPQPSREEPFEITVRGRTARPDVVKSMAEQFDRHLERVADTTVESAEVCQRGVTHSVRGAIQKREEIEDAATALSGPVL